MNEIEHITVFRFQKAPQFLKNLSTNGGDEDWVAVVPRSMVHDYIPWLCQPSFGVCSVDTYEHPVNPDLYVVIGSHA